MRSGGEADSEVSMKPTRHNSPTHGAPTHGAPTYGSATYGSATYGSATYGSATYGALRVCGVATGTLGAERAVVGSGRTRDLLSGMDRWRRGRLVVLFLCLLGLIGFQTVIPEIGFAEIAEHVVSVESRFCDRAHGGSVDRQNRMRKCLNFSGSWRLVLRRCCRTMSEAHGLRPVASGHRRPDNSLAPLLI